MSRMKSTLAVLLTVFTILHVGATLPFMQKGVGFREMRRVLLFVGWKTDWRMFAPDPRRTFPAKVIARYYHSDSHPQDDVIFDFNKTKTDFFFKGVDKSHWFLFYLRLFADRDCANNCQRLLNSLVRREFEKTGEPVSRAELVYSEFHVPDMKKEFINIENVPLLPMKERLRFGGKYGL